MLSKCNVMVALATLVTTTFGDENCIKTFDSVGTSFDLSPLKSGLFYKVNNKDVTYENYTYAFNICEDIKDENIPGAGPRGSRAWARRRRTEEEAPRLPPVRIS